MKIKTKILILAVIISASCGAVMSFGFSQAQSEKTIDISAYLVGSGNESVTNGEYEVRFALYAVERKDLDPYPSNTDAGKKIWEENQKIKIYDGVLNADLGSVNPLPDSLHFSEAVYYLGIRIGNDSEMVPRKKVNAVPLTIDSYFIRGKTIGTSAGNIPVLNSQGQLDTSLVAGSKIKISGSSYLKASGMKITAGKINLASHVAGTLPVAYGGTGNNTSATTGVPYISAGNWLYETALSVSRGGTGLSSIADGSILYSNASNSLTTLTGDATDDGETLTFNWNSGSPTVSWETAAGSGDIIAVGDVASGNAFTSGGSGSSLWFHSGANTGELTVAALTGNRTYTLSNESGTICTTGSVCTGYQAAGNYLTTATVFGGDVSGAYNAIVVANDSHTHGVTTGGTGIITYATGDILYASAINTLSRLSAGAEGRVLTVSGGIPVWSATAPGAAHNLLSSSHADTAIGTVARGDIVTGQGAVTFLWTKLALGVSGYYLRSDGMDAAWSGILDGDIPAALTRDIEWDTQGEAETIWGATLATDAELSAHAGLAAGTHGAAGTIVGTSDSQTLTNKTYNGLTLTSNADGY